jgi:hypothetical protein
MSRARRIQQGIASALSLPALALDYQRGLGEAERRMLLCAMLTQRSRNRAPTVSEAATPGLIKCKAPRKTPMSLQLELFARGVSRIR